MFFSCGSRPPKNRGKLQLKAQKSGGTVENESRQEPGIWLVFSHAFSSISRITSRVNYIIHRNSPLAARLGLRYIRYPDLIRKLKELAGCNLVRHRGRHEIWENEAGKRFPVPRHPGDLKTGTLAKIIKQAGLSMTVQQFLSARPELIGSE
jgi:predicted RNA binding protein YcfA (HicA-like mRNA interferase family)